MGSYADISLLISLVRRRSFSVACLSIAIFLSESCASIRTDEFKRTISGTTVSRGGVSVEFSVPPSVRVDHPVELLVNLVNESQTPIFYGISDRVRELNIEIVGSNHEMPKVTLEGEHQWRPTRSFWGSFQKLKPGDSTQWHVDLANLFLLPPADTRSPLTWESRQLQDKQGLHFPPGRLSLLLDRIGRVRLPAQSRS
jgi:hypothetical protein